MFLARSLPMYLGVGEMGGWQDKARCRGQDAELFFADDDESTRRRARAFCANCPVWWECLADALNREEREGMWGGLRPAERARLRRVRRQLEVTPQDPANLADIRLLECVLPEGRLGSLLVIESDEPAARAVGRMSSRESYAGRRADPAAAQ